ncbi:MAG TPA: hypothetical protein GXX35_13640 [Thermoanaerobacterales bacterium]|nr:hypothetical protein [Thermoanaerobacterales bacterium]
MDIVKIVTVLSLIIESLTKTILLIWNTVTKPFSQWTQEEKKEIITDVISVIIAIGVNLDIFSLANIPFKIPILGPFLTGLLLARGAGVVTDILDIIYYTKVNRKIKTLM